MNIRTKDELVDYLIHGNKVKYVFFWGHQKSGNGVSKSCFSQWYDAPFECNGNEFMTAEHYMMFRKALLFDDSDAAQRLLAAKTPGEAKAIGREVKGFNQAKWNECRFDIVVAGNLAKFDYNPQLKAFLLNTGDRVLVEASPVDKIWGNGLTGDDPDREHPELWPGENLLGFALMEVRNQLSG